MKIIADSGSTKTEWVLLENDTPVHNHKTQGINPYIQNSEQISVMLQEELPQVFHTTPVEALYYYGAGCSIEEKINTVANGLKPVFKLASSIQIYHDMLGAARSVCGKEKGIAAILGTGSNVCLFNGTEIYKSIVSLGYVLGDEGSGNHIGRIFLKKLFYNNIDEVIKEKFFSAFKLSLNDLVNSIYNKPFPNRFLASFTPFLYANIEHPQLKKIVSDCFNEFINVHVIPIAGNEILKFNCVGSVGFLFRNILEEELNKKQIKVGTIIQSPIEGLIKFHH